MTLDWFGPTGLWLSMTNYLSPCEFRNRLPSPIVTAPSYDSFEHQMHSTWNPTGIHDLFNALTVLYLIMCSICSYSSPRVANDTVGVGTCEVPQLQKVIGQHGWRRHAVTIHDQSKFEVYSNWPHVLITIIVLFQQSRILERYFEV